ncbi:MAG: serine/threonine protein kinase [Symploca sp. SIO3C6]|nr:serine/threonine protein kinase [Symploca sp. SIO3C6]NET04203.1 serine/threonine protein kinase [Symploca sp. SIO2B6]
MLQAQQVLQERYQLQTRLGRTAAGRQTWLAKDVKSSEQVILKLLAFSPQMQWEELKLFEREAQVLQSLNHPRIPRYRDYFCLDLQTGAQISWFGLVQQYIPGVSLQEFIESGKRLTQKQAKKIATEILQILVYLHQLSPPVLHRDIKPSNLILTENKQVYLVDFGAVQAQAAVTGVTFTVVGTSGYAPLEQFWGRAVAASDLYALGATLIHLITGIAPADLPQKDSRLQFAEYVNNLDPIFVGWIEKMTEIALEKRYSTATQALEALKSGQVQPKDHARNSVIRKIPKPSGSYIQLNKSREQLKITVPAPGLRKLATSGLLGLFFYLYIGGITVLSVVVGLVAGIIEGPPLLSVFCTASLLAILASLAKLFGERTHVDLNREYLDIERETLGISYGKHGVYFGRILGVLLNQKGQVYQVLIRSENKNYRLGGALGENEGAWLAQEIQDWLQS